MSLVSLSLKTRIVKWVWPKQLEIEALAGFFRLKAPLPKSF
jgi:hypothetical protein